MNKYEVMAAPDLIGKFGRAWKLNEKDHRTAIAGYFVRRAGAHAFWCYWMVCCVHLRAVEGMPPAVLHYPEAEYEFLIAALDPDEKIPDPRYPVPPGSVKMLTPIDVCEQFHGTTDEQAAQLVEQAIKAIIHTGITPDQDARAWWKEAIKNGVEHAVTGHPRGHA